MSCYLNPYTDFGFKKLFGEEGNKDLLIDFLNQNLENFDSISAILNEPLFQKAFKILEEANLSPEQREQYQKSLFAYWELKGVVDTALEEGWQKGILQVTRTMKQNSLPIELIQPMTGLTPTGIEALK